MKQGPSNKSTDPIKDLIKLASSGPTGFDKFSEKFDLVKDAITPEMILKKGSAIDNREISLFELSVVLLIETNYSQPFIKIWEIFGSSFDIKKLCEIKFSHYPKMNFLYVLAMAAVKGNDMPLLSVISTFNSTLPLDLITVKEVKDFSKQLKKICVDSEDAQLQKYVSEEVDKLNSLLLALQATKISMPRTIIPQNLKNNLNSKEKSMLSQNGYKMMHTYGKQSIRLNKLPFISLLALSEIHHSAIFLPFWQLFNNHINFKQLLQRRSYKSLPAIIAYEAPIFYLIEAAIKGNPEPLVTVLQYYKNDITLDDLMMPVFQNYSDFDTLYDLLSTTKIASILNVLNDITSDLNINLKIEDPNFVLNELTESLHSKIPLIIKHPKFDIHKAIEGSYKSGNIDVNVQIYGSDIFTESHFFEYSNLYKRRLKDKVQLFHAFALSSQGSVTDSQSKKAKLICDYIESDDPEKKSLGFNFIQKMIKEDGLIPNAFNFHGWTPLLAAVTSNNFPVIDLILNSQSKLFTTTNKDVTTFTIIATLENASVLAKILRKLKSELGEALFVKHILSMLTSHNRTLLRCRVSISPENVSQYVISADHSIDNLVANLIRENILSFVTLDLSMQQNICLSFGTQLELNPDAVQALIDQSLELLFEHDLINYNKGQINFTNDKSGLTKSKLIQQLSSKYKWLTPIRGYSDSQSLNSRSPTKINTELHFATITIDSFYNFFNELSQGLQSIQDTLSDNDKNLPPLTAGIPNTPNTTPNTSKALQIPTDTFKTSAAKPKKFKENSHPDNLVSSSPKPAESQRRKAKKKKVNTSKKQPTQPTQRAQEKSQEVSASIAPLPRAAEYIFAPASDKPFDFKIQDNNKADPKATSKTSSINEEISMVSNIVNTKDLPRLLGGLATDHITATMLLRLTCLYGILKMNRQLAVNNRGFYRLNCDLIHGSFETLFEEFMKPELENSPLWLFLKNTFSGNVCNYKDLLILEHERFYINSKQALVQRSAPTATCKRLHLIKCLIEFIKTIKPYLDKDLEYYQFYKNAFAATIIVLGEQYARLCEFSPALVTKLHKTAAGATLIKYRDYRNLHHGVNTAPSIATFQNDDQEYQAFINFDTDWDDQLLELIHDLNDDIHCLGDFTLAANLQSMITELENNLKKSSTLLSYSAFRQATVLQQKPEVEEELEKLDEQMGNLTLNPGH